LECAFSFFANEHLPVHIHVQNADGRAKFQVLPKVKIIAKQRIKIIGLETGTRGY
jgi:hypothetical protein